jgi:superkiller protein 3
MDKKNFMYKILEAKKYYFLGLNKRFEAGTSKNNALFRESLALQFKGLEYEPEASFILNEIGNVYASMQQNKQAKAYFEKAIELTPTWSIPYSNLCVLNKDNPVVAIKYGKRAVKIDPKNVLALNSLGTAYLNNENLEEAEYYFVKALKIAPKYSTAWYNLACIYSLQENLTESLRLLEQAFYNGMKDHEIPNQDPDLIYVRRFEEYSQLLSKYFPEKVKSK